MIDFNIIKKRVAARRTAATGQVEWAAIPDKRWNIVRLRLPSMEAAEAWYSIWDAPYTWCSAQGREFGTRWARRLDRASREVLYKFDNDRFAVLCKLMFG